MTDIKNIKNISRSHRMSGDSTQSYSFYSLEKDNSDNLLNSFKVIEMFLPACIGRDYVRSLPKGFLENIFRRCDLKKRYDIRVMSEDDKNYFRCDFSNKIAELNRSLYYIIEPYISVVTSNKRNIEKLAEVKTNRYTITSKVEDSNYPIPTADIEYKVFPSIKEYIEKNQLDKKALDDVDYLLDRLAEIASLSVFVDNEEDSYARFAYRIIRKMKANYTASYPRSIVNYSAFEFSAEGYPYDTISRNIYSIKDVPCDVRNKFALHDIYINNVESILRFMADLTFNSKLHGVELDGLNFETKVLSNVFGVVIALLALNAEKTMNDYLLNNSLMSKSFN